MVGASVGKNDPDTIRILISSDNHVGYNERDAKRKDDSWKSFHEIMCLARQHDVDMVLLAGDLFHDNKPSRKALYQVMRSIRMNCFGDKPVEIEMLSDPSENFQGAFNHVNYEDPNINIAIPIFSIHGNHDDPSGEGFLAALDILQMAGLINYYGRTPESDNLVIKPILLQKGRTKLALYGISNVRDERLFRTFRDGKVKFFRPNICKDEWFNILSVHQNHHAYSDTGYLPENFLPSFMDLVVWGHEHECLIEPRYNPEMKFRVMQPGSSVATSLVVGEAVPKHVAIVSITGKEFVSKAIRLKSVRPLVVKEIILAKEREMRNVWKRDDNRQEITRFLQKEIKKLIEQAKADWLDGQDAKDIARGIEAPLPLIRLRVEYSSPEEGGKFDCENPQRISNYFMNEVANVNDIVQFHRRKRGTKRIEEEDGGDGESGKIEVWGKERVKMEQLVRESLSAQSLVILPQNSFAEALEQYVEKDDKYALEVFVKDNLANQLRNLLVKCDKAEDVKIMEVMKQYKNEMENTFSTSNRNDKLLKKTIKAKPEFWDDELDGDWEDQPEAQTTEKNGTDKDMDRLDNEGEVKGKRGNSKVNSSGKKNIRKGRGGKGKVEDNDEGNNLE